MLRKLIEKIPGKTYKKWREVVSGAAARTGDFKKSNNIEINYKERRGCDKNTLNKRTR